MAFSDSVVRAALAARRNAVKDAAPLWTAGTGNVRRRAKAKRPRPIPPLLPIAKTIGKMLRW